MAAKIIAVDIEETTIRLLQVRKNRIERWASAAVDAGPTSDGVTPDPARLGSQVRQLMRASGINSGQVVLSLSGLYSVSRVLTLPLPSQTETEGVLLGLVQEALPAGGLTLRYRVISANEAGRRVLALGVPSDIVQGQTTVMQAAGLRVYAMEPRTLALTTAVNQEWAVIINVEPSSLDLVVVATGIPSIMRTVPLPTGLDAEERAGQVALALEKTVAFYHEQNPLLQLPSDTPLFLVGSLAEDPVLRKSVTDAVPYPLATFEPSLEFPSYLPCSQHAVTIGLALSQLSRRGRARRGARPLFIDFLPNPMRPLRSTLRGALIVVAVVAGLSLINLLYGPVAAANRVTGELEREHLRLEQQVTQRQTELDRSTQLQAAIRDFKAITIPWGQVTEMVELLQGTLPPGVLLTSVTVDASQVRLVAKAGNVEQAIAFVEALRATGRFQEVPYTSISADISVTLKLVPPKAK